MNFFHLHTKKHDPIVEVVIVVILETGKTSCS